MNTKLNELLLTLLEGYKKALILQAVYHDELGQSHPQFVGSIRQAHLDAKEQSVNPLFQEAEQGLKRGENPQYLLENLLETLYGKKF